jgi:Group II intron, maturase-specific domain
MRAPIELPTIARSTPGYLGLITFSGIIATPTSKWPMATVVDDLNLFLRGWAAYFRFALDQREHAGRGLGSGERRGDHGGGSPGQLGVAGVGLDHDRAAGGERAHRVAAGHAEARVPQPVPSRAGGEAVS